MIYCYLRLSWIYGGSHWYSMQRPTEENLYEDGYDAIGAQADYEQKRKACRRKRKLDDPELYALVKEKFLEQQWSPEQIQYRLRHENSQHSISSATIYRAIYAGLFNDPDWVRSGKRNLRHRGKKRLYNEQQTQVGHSCPTYALLAAKVSENCATIAAPKITKTSS